ncbi:unnamed protein product [Dibothriocephalus latus]|uniref:Uncharacterized protein n=1 Tax=Dibothriocephalus latus TaxID=60516 RepID=A0A3P6T526_DIBLA|nr:unnamed protein product [Dibothriocephalus latus]
MAYGLLNPLSSTSPLFLFFAHAAMEESIFVIGGQPSQQTGSTRVDEFMVKERRWYQRAPLAVGRQDHAAAIVRVGSVDRVGAEKSLVGIFGGSFEQGNDWSRITSCELYEVSQDR